MTDILFVNASKAEIDSLLVQYPQNPAAGSPFNTGLNNSITPEFKRIAAILGDYVFQAPRRFFLEQRFDKQRTFSFCEFFVTTMRIKLSRADVPSS